MKKNKSFFNRKEFVDAFFNSFGMEGNMAFVLQERRILSEIENMISDGFSKYEAIMELCHQHHISFDISEKSSSDQEVKTFMDAREWSHMILKNENTSLAIKLGREIANMLCIKYTNLIIIDNIKKQQ